MATSKRNKGRRRTLNKEQERQVKAWLKEGDTYREIADRVMQEYGITVSAQMILNINRRG
jgi:transposase